MKCWRAVAQTAGLNAGQALKNAVKNVQAGQKLEKQKGKVKSFALKTTNLYFKMIYFVFKLMNFVVSTDE